MLLHRRTHLIGEFLETLERGKEEVLQVFIATHTHEAMENSYDLWRLKSFESIFDANIFQKLFFSSNAERKSFGPIVDRRKYVGHLGCSMR